MPRDDGVQTGSAGLRGAARLAIAAAPVRYLVGGPGRRSCSSTASAASPGTGGSSRPALAAERRVIVPELPGPRRLGAACRRAPTLDPFADAVLAVLEAEDAAARAVGRALARRRSSALRAAVRRPDAVTGLVLAAAAGISSATRIGEADRDGDRASSSPGGSSAAPAQRVARSRLGRTLAFGWWGVADPAGFDPEMAEAFLAGPPQHTDTRERRAGRSSRPIRGPISSGCGCPCLCLWGASDNWVPLAGRDGVRPPAAGAAAHDRRLRPPADRRAAGRRASRRREFLAGSQPVQSSSGFSAARGGEQLQPCAPPNRGEVTARARASGSATRRGGSSACSSTFASSAAIRPQPREIRTSSICRRAMRRRRWRTRSSARAGRPRARRTRRGSSSRAACAAERAARPRDPRASRRARRRARRHLRRLGSRPTPRRVSLGCRRLERDHLRSALAARAAAERNSTRARSPRRVAPLAVLLPGPAPQAPRDADPLALAEVLGAELRLAVPRRHPDEVRAGRPGRRGSTASRKLATFLSSPTSRSSTSVARLPMRLTLFMTRR